MRRQSSGHRYFSLKDSGSQLPCVLFARDAARQSFQIEEGMEVVLFGDISVYEPHGRYQLIAKIAIESGIGRLQAQFEQLKRRLHAEGLFDKQRKQALPAVPTRIAVITSPTGAAIHKTLHILHRRAYREVVIFPHACKAGTPPPKSLRCCNMRAPANRARSGDHHARRRQH